MIVVITPTHNPKYLPEAAQSLREQTYRGDWVWAIFPNSGCGSELWTMEGIDGEIFPPLDTSISGNIGAIKRRVCELVREQYPEETIVVELDHDDLLTPEALQQISDAFTADPDLGFVYSNFAEFYDGSWNWNCYHASGGWIYRDREFYGHPVKEAIGFPPTAHTLMSIYHAPNHVRAWRASEYWKVGGHDPAMRVIDDHDLMCRFYINSKMAHINDCLYLYRLHSGNSYLDASADPAERKPDPEIIKLTEDVRNKYLDNMVFRWGSSQGAMIDICCGRESAPGYVGVDVKHGDILTDLNKAWPFLDNSVSVVRAFDALEHLQNPLHTMREVYRVLVPGGWLLSLTPSTDGRGAFQDPTHVSFWNENSFWYYTRAAQAQFVDSRVRFQAVRNTTFFPSDYHRQVSIPYVRADLVAIKEDYRAPGPVYV